MKVPDGAELGILLIGTEDFFQVYDANLDAFSCYTARYNYALLTVDLKSRAYLSWCIEFEDFFFRKHCVVAHMLERLPPELGIFVFDLDVTVFNFDVPLEKGAERADVVLYERENNHEVAAGNYFVRNTPFARRFLLHWASYNHRRPTGFSFRT